jgi:hypothetical protein
MPEFHQESEFIAGSVKIVVDLGTMFRCEFLHSLDFNNDLIETNKIGNVLLFQKTSFVPQDEFKLGPDTNALGLEF